MCRPCGAGRQGVVSGRWSFPFGGPHHPCCGGAVTSAPYLNSRGRHGRPRGHSPRCAAPPECSRPIGAVVPRGCGAVAPPWHPAARLFATLRHVLDWCGGGGVGLGARVAWAPPAAGGENRADRGHPPPDRCKAGISLPRAVVKLRAKAVPYRGFGADWWASRYARLRAAWACVAAPRRRCCCCGRYLLPDLPPAPVGPAGASRGARGCALGPPGPGLRPPPWVWLLPVIQSVLLDFWGLTFRLRCGTMLLRGCAAPSGAADGIGVQGCSERALSKDRAFSFCPNSKILGICFHLFAGLIPCWSTPFSGPRPGFFAPFDSPEIVNSILAWNSKGGPRHPFPRLTQQNIVILLRSLGLFIGQLTCCPNQLNKIIVLFRLPI